ncbi:hypothetical protein T190611E02C_70002 [Tenacibaculum sp. 190524A05c]
MRNAMLDKYNYKFIYLLLILLFSVNVEVEAQKYRIVFSAEAAAEPCSPDPIRNSRDIVKLENTNTGRAAILAIGVCADLVDTQVNAVRIIDFLPNAVSRERYAETNSGSVVVDEFQRVNVNFNHCDSRSTTLSTFGATVLVSIEPHVDIIDRPDNNAICQVNLEVDVEGFAPEVYKWQFYDQFSSASNKWTNFPSALQGSHIASFDLEQLVGNRASQFHNTSMKFRMQKYCTGNYTPEVIYSIIACSPALIGNPNPKDLDCSYDEDASFELKLNRNLITSKSERLIVTLYDANTGILKDQDDVLSLTNNGDGTYSYNWTKRLVGGTYEVKYQTKTGNDVATLVEPNSFIIDTPDALNFNVVKVNDKSCFTNADGKIRITITNSEPGRTFQYKIYRETTSGVITYRNWTNFSSSSIEVGSLEDYDYRIKVRDNKQCYAR